jgi:NAD(P)-dependent dehydrogenase (short-subunit alcohol dehydrogenase family)
MVKGPGAKHDEALTMIGEQHWEKIGVAYENLIAQSSAEVEGCMCWPVDFFPEEMPTENGPGTATNLYLANLANPTDCVSNWPPPQMDEVWKEDILIFSDSYGYCKEIIEQAPPGRVGIVNIQSKAPDKYADKDIKNLISMHPWDLIIFAVGIDPPPSNTVDAMHKTQEAVYLLYLNLLKRIADLGNCKRFCVLTADCFAEEREVHEECGISLITNSNLWGMTNTARQEVNGVPFQYIDTEWALATENTKYIAAEIFRHQSFGHQKCVRILNRGRYVMKSICAKDYELGPNLELPNEGVVAITGGNGALGLVMGTWFMSTARQQGGKKFSMSFLSRSCKISDQNEPNWKEVCQSAEELGISVSQDKGDFSSAAAVDAWLEKVSPNLVGFIHSAGVLQDSMLMNQTPEKFEKVYEGKSRAALFVHDALERMENPSLKFFWVFSSGATYGSMGQLNYSGSNSFLDALCRHRRAMGKVAMAPGWGAWGDVGMEKNLDEANRRRMANGPFPYFTNAEGLHGMEQLIRTNFAYGAVMRANLPMVFGMCGGDEPEAQCEFRNFYSIYAPHPPGDPYKNSYNTIIHAKQNTSTKMFKGLVFKYFYPHVAEALEELDDSSNSGFAV